MNLIDAVKSGKPWRRMAWAKARPNCTYHFGRGMLGADGFYLTVEDILADDWEIEESLVPITKPAPTPDT